MMPTEQRKETKKRGNAALKAMENLGIERERVKPVLLRLLQVSGNQWDYIENENYRVLADAIFESPSESENSKEGCDVIDKDALSSENGHREKRLKSCEEPASPTKVVKNGPTCQSDPYIMKVPVQKRPLEEQTAPVCTNKPILSLPPASSRLPVPVKPDSTKPRDGGINDTPLVLHMKPVVLHKPEGSKLIRDAEISNNNKIVPHKREETMDLACTPVKCHLRRVRNDSNKKTNGREIDPQPLAMVYPNNQGTSSRNSVDKGKAKVNDITEQSTNQSATLEIASCESKDVNISFECHDNIITDPNFHPPSIEEICRQVERKCMSSYKILNPNFSLLNVLSEMCKSFKEIGYMPAEKRKDNLVQIVPAPGTEHIFQGITGYHSSNPTFTTMALVPYDVTKPPPHDPDDISRGLENVRVSIERDPQSKEEYPPPFQYISSNLSDQNAYVSISLARIGDESCCSDCHGDCLQSPVPCACAAETGGCFAYTKDGLLREEFLDACIDKWKSPRKEDFFFCKENCPLERVNHGKKPDKCKGHLMKKFIKECWAKCACKFQCGNRVVQRGISRNLQIFKASEEKGWGLRTLEDLPKGSFVCEYVGVILTNIELYERQMRIKGSTRHTYPVLLDADWSTEGILKDEEALCLDATHYGNVARFINHRCHDGNMIGIPVEIETPDHHYYHLAFFTNKDVAAMEELTWDYGIDFKDHDHPIKAFMCKCGSQYCRDVKPLLKTRTKPSQHSRYIFG